ncbi:hypothetical protein WA026_012831, partial [Henosepilachna vigintioctopunctata]
MPKKARRIGPIARQNELLQKACAYLDFSSKNNETEIPTIAKAWGEKLLQLHPLQRALAERAINDVLFEASQGTLHRHSVKINEGFSYESSTVASPVDNVPQIPSPQQQGFRSTQNDRLKYNAHRFPKVSDPSAETDAEEIEQTSCHHALEALKYIGHWTTAKSERGYNEAFRKNG